MVRLRHRYITVEVEFQGKKIPPNRNPSLALMTSLNRMIKQLHGSVGVALAKAGLFVNYFNLDTGMAFIRMRRSAYDIVSSALPLVTTLDGHPVLLRTLHTSATIRHSSLFLQKLQRRALMDKYSTITSEEGKAEFKKELDKIRTNTTLLNLTKAIGKRKSTAQEEDSSIP